MNYIIKWVECLLKVPLHSVQTCNLFTYFLTFLGTLNIPVDVYNSGKKPLINCVIFVRTCLDKQA